MATASFAPSKSNQIFLRTVNNKSALINQLLDEYRKHQLRQEMLQGFNNMGQDPEMQEWLDIANNPSNL